MVATISPLPEMLHRNDVNKGEWEVDHCEAMRGVPYTNIVDKKMVVPHDDDNLSRTIRAHEMMHAKISPANDFEKWVERDVASLTGMKAVEEVRVNFLIGKAGFDTKSLSDGSELLAGERIGESGDWANAVYTTIAFTCTGGLNQFLTGVRRHNKEWAKALRELARKVEKEINSVYNTGELASTEVCSVTGLSPKGFFDVERIAQWVDTIAYPPSDSDAEETDTDEDTTDDDSTKGKKVPMSGDDIKKTRPTQRSRTGTAEWAEMSIVRAPLPRRTRGGIGKTRRASNMGTNPRRISRMLTDSERRVFDTTRRGTGGVVLIDGSGSMHLSTSDIMRITEASAGCTVAVYSTYSGRRDGGRLYIVAENGRMVEEVDESRGGGNGCDGPALRWAIKQARKGAPVVWVCDGIVTGWTDDMHERLSMECVNLVRKNKVWMSEDVDGAVQVLNDLRRGSKPKRWMPWHLRRVEASVTGTGR